MASDSRLTLTRTHQEKDGKVEEVVFFSDSSYKTFLIQKNSGISNNIGISSWGPAEIKDVPIAGFIEAFIDEKLSQGNYEVDQVPQELLNYFRDISGRKPNFLVAGYKKVNNVSEQHIWEVLGSKDQPQRRNQKGKYSALWAGEKDIITKILNQVYKKNKETGNYTPIVQYQVDWKFFTLQDAIDYVIYAVRTTIDTMRFQSRSKSVGGPIDVLVIKPDKAWWVQKKEIHGYNSSSI